MAAHVILVQCDDTAVWGYQIIDQLPWVKTFMRDNGITFLNYRAVTPRCGPNRASLFKSQYPHEHTVSGNDWAGAGNKWDQSETIATAMERAGYTCMLFGKYSNEWAGNNCTRSDCTTVPPGWSRASTSIGLESIPHWQAFKSNGDYIGDSSNGNQYPLYLGNADGSTTVQNRGTHDRGPDDPDTDYSTDLLAYRLARAIENTPADEAVFAYFAPKASHEPLTPPVRYAGSANPAGVWNPLSFNEGVPGAFDPDDTDKPAWVQALPKDPGATPTSLLSRYRVLRAVDDALNRIFTACVNSGRTTAPHTTLVLLTSDNGFLLGDHRVTEGKNAVYNGSRGIPLLGYWPGQMGVTPRDVPDLVRSIDIAPTILELAGGSFSYTPSGKSFAHILRGTGLDDTFNSSILISSHIQVDEVPPWEAVETDAGETVVRLQYSNPPEKEYYKADDPDELASKHASASDLIRFGELDALLEATAGTLLTRIFSASTNGSTETTAASPTLAIPVTEEILADKHCVLPVFATNSVGQQVFVSALDTKANAWQPDVPTNTGTSGPGIYALSCRLDTTLAVGDIVTVSFKDSNGNGVQMTNRNGVLIPAVNVKETGWFRGASPISSGTGTVATTNQVNATENGWVLALFSAQISAGNIHAGSGYIEKYVKATGGRVVGVMDASIFPAAPYAGSATLNTPANWFGLILAYDWQPTDVAPQSAEPPVVKFTEAVTSISRTRTLQTA